MRNVELTDRDRRLLELLGRGLSNEDIARKLGYSHGSIRVYLHKLYKKVGVEGKTAAALWYLEASASSAAPVPAADESVGDMALRTNLLTALGAMSLFIGPYGKLWHVAARLKSSTPQPGGYENRQRCRPLWEALLKGDFAQGKRATDPRSPVESLLVLLLLRLGHFTKQAGKLSATLLKRKSIGPGEVDLLDAVQEAAPGRIEKIAAKFDSFAPSRHVVLATLFHVYKASGDPQKAGRTAETLWAEAEVSRQHLKAMGEPAVPYEVAAEPSHRRRKVASQAR